MSLGELIVILLIALLIMKPGDIKFLLQKIYKIKNYINNFKGDIYKALELESNVTTPLKEEAEQLNFYLKKIIDIEGNYYGEYSLDELKKKYKQVTLSSENDIANSVALGDGREERSL